MAAYHKDNTDRMGTTAPNLIPVLVGLLPHPDPEVQVHAATALANLAYGSPSYQSEAGEAGAIAALLDLCCGRAGVGGGRGGGGSNRGDGGEGDGKTEGTLNPAVDMDAVVEGGEQSESREQAGRGGMGVRSPPNTTIPGRKEDLMDGSAIKTGRMKVQQGLKTEEEGEWETGDKSRTGDRWARKRDSEQEQGTSGTEAAILSTDEVSAAKSATLVDHCTDGRSTPKDGGDRRASEEERGQIYRIHRSERIEGSKVEDEGGEQVTAADTMDVDAVQAATAALANLLCYSETNSVRLVAAGGIGVLVGLVSSYRPHNLLDTDQVCDWLLLRLRVFGCEPANVEAID